jgi:hypothetical protein
MALPQLKINKKGKITTINGNKLRFEVKKYITLPQSIYLEKNIHKTFVLEELEFENGDREIRVGYYIIGKKGRAKGKWVWGQFCPFFPKKDLIRLIEKAKKAKII